MYRVLGCYNDGTTCVLTESADWEWCRVFAKDAFDQADFRGSSLVATLVQWLQEDGRWVPQKMFTRGINF